MAGCRLFPSCRPFLSVQNFAALFGSGSTGVVSGFGRIWHCHSRDTDITTKCKVMENQSWEEAVVKRTSPVAVVALFRVLWVFLDTTPISRTGGRIKHSSVVLSDMVNEKVKQRNMVVNRACESHQQNIKPQLLSRLELVYVLD